MNTPWVLISVRTLVLVALIGGLYVAHSNVVSMRNQYRSTIQQLDEAPKHALESASRSAELSRRELDIKRVEKLLVDRENVADLIGVIESEAEKNAIEANVPQINEIEDSKGVVEDIELRVSADGFPANLIAFAHSVENLAYIITLKDFSLTTRSSTVPQNAARAPAGSNQVTEITSGHVEFTILLGVKKQTNEQ